MTNDIMETEQTKNTNEIIEPLYKNGVVINCFRLNVREKPNINSKIVTVLDKSVNVKINCDNSTDEFYSVTTSSGIKGFCMKKFVEVKE